MKNKPNIPNPSEWLSHILGRCMCLDTDETCWFNRTWQSLDDGTKDSEYEDIKRAIEPLQEAAIQAKLAEQRETTFEHAYKQALYDSGYGALGKVEGVEKKLREMDT